MSLLVDSKFLLHSMRIKYLRIEDRIGDRVISFSPIVMANDYVKTAAPAFPEMQYCYSPTYNTQDNYLSQSKKIPLGGFSSGNMQASESTTSSIYTMSSGKAKSLAFTKRGEPSGRKAVQIAPPRISRSEEEQQQGDSEDDIDYEGESHSGSGRSRTPMYDRKSPGEGPALFVQPPSKPPTIGTDDFDGESFSPDSDMNRMASSHGRGSQSHVTPSTLVSNHSNGPRTPASLDPSVDSTPSPYTSPDVGSNSLEGVRLNMRSEHTPPVPPLLQTNVTTQNAGRGILLNPTTREPQIQSANSTQLRTRILDSSQPSPLSMVRSPLVAGGRAGAPGRAKSNLTALIHEKQSTVDNPFAEEYSFFAGKGEPNPMNMIIYLPFSSKSKEPMKVAVKRDTIVEDVIGYILYQYMEERRLPHLEPEKCDVTKWVLRMAEDDGEVDEDIPPFDRMHKINKISFDEFALCEATVAQQKANQQTHEKILKSHPKREKPGALLSTAASPSPANPTTPTQPVTPTSPTPNTHQPQPETLPPSASAIPVPTAKNTLTKSALTNPAYQNLKVRLEEEGGVSATTLLSVYADMFVGDVLEMVCRKRRLDPKLYVLKVADKDVIIPLDRTMESLHEVEEMALVKKTEAVPSNSGGTIWRNNRNRKKDNSSEVLLPSASTDSAIPNEYMGQYKKYIVNRKSNMLVGRHERVLAIDGDYIHLMPPEQKGMFERMKTSSYHISQVHSCRQAKKTPQNFKLVVLKDREQKAYELEAETTKDAHEICERIYFLQQVNKGSQVRV